MDCIDIIENTTYKIIKELIEQVRENFQFY